MTTPYLVCYPVVLCTNYCSCHEDAVMNPSAALQSTVEDFLDSLSQTPAAAQGELINCVFRACGCNHAIDGDEALDYDGIVDALDNITEAFKQDDIPIYPLTSKLSAFKPFRTSLSEFLSRLISSAAAMGQLYSTEVMTTLQAWVIAMSSSQLRSFRHTASVVALEVETALCEVAAAVEKETEMVSRQKEGERKRKKGKTEPTTAREKELDGKAAEVRDRRTKLAEFLKEFVDGYVFCVLRFHGTSVCLQRFRPSVSRP
jgi:cohesin complex subunit SA-1/2